LTGILIITKRESQNVISAGYLLIMTHYTQTEKMKGFFLYVLISNMGPLDILSGFYMIGEKYCEMRVFEMCSAML
jgi:hypothetical protein